MAKKKKISATRTGSNKRTFKRTSDDADNLFAKAKANAVDASPRKKKAKKRKAKKMKGLEAYATVVALRKMLAAAESALREELVEQAQEHFVKNGCALGSRPENFRAKDGDAEASIELRQRSSRSYLNDAEVRALTKRGISVDTVGGEGHYRINPQYADSDKLLKRAAKALAGVKGLPADFIQYVEGEERRVVAADSIDEVFALSPKKAAKLLPMVGVFAVKPSLEVDDIEDAMAMVGDLLSDGRDDD